MISEILPTSFAGISTTACLVAGACFSLLLYRHIASGRLLVELPGPPKEDWMTGHYRKLFGPNGTQYHEYLVSTYGPTLRINGAFGDEIIFTVDPTALDAIFVKDRMPVFMNIAEQTSDAIKRDLSNSRSSSKELDIFPWMTAAALELVGEAGLGYSFDSLTGKRNEYNIAIKSVIRLTTQASPYARILPLLYNFGTPAFRRWAVQYIPLKIVRQMRHAVTVQNEQAEEVLRARQALLSSGSDLSAEAGRGRDIMTLLMKANEAEGSENHISRQAMIGHMK
ncbi:cytochrome P450 family protein [Ceratobasidium sp. AG-Ba]|nr:cytochrome P450 family protein [Ceratobasidium sp. AG-Ba]QRW09824.1 cytochrome P450 family protein [Ceratobasidium sp. AG-Ba]